MWRRIYGPEVKQGIGIIRSNQEMRELYKYLDIVADMERKHRNKPDM
jgi:hypothetical protein